MPRKTGCSVSGWQAAPFRRALFVFGWFSVCMHGACLLFFVLVDCECKVVSIVVKHSNTAVGNLLYAVFRVNIRVHPHTRRHHTPTVRHSQRVGGLLVCPYIRKTHELVRTHQSRAPLKRRVRGQNRRRDLRPHLPESLEEVRLADLRGRPVFFECADRCLSAQGHDLCAKRECSRRTRL